MTDATQPVLRISKWTETFERAESRKLKQLTWIAMPVGFSSTGYQAMLEEFEARAPAIYGAWCALCAYAATCHVRGTLGNSRGIPLKISHLARVTGFPESVFVDLVAWASRTDIGWLEHAPAAEVSRGLAEQQEKHSELATSGESPDEPPTVQGNPPSTRPNVTEQDITGQDKTKTRRSIVWTSAGFEFRESVRLLARDMSEMQTRGKLRGLDRDTIWRMAWVATDIDRAGFLDALSRIRENQIEKHKNYLGTVMVRMCQAAGESWDAIKHEVPSAPPPPAKPAPQPAEAC
jgi:hypothetical protein